MQERNRNLRLVIVTGLSGAGKTQATRCLEDLGFFCVDNLPPMLIPKFTELCQQAEGKVNRVALVVDVRGGLFFQSLSEELRNLTREGIRYEILFLEASDDVLVRRFKESRRQHPLGGERTILEAIQAERAQLEEIRGMADVVIDTSKMSIRDLKESLARIFEVRKEMAITLVSFGYKYGIPLDADLVFDVRFLPNPNYVRELKDLTGLDKRVDNYIFSFQVSRSFLRRFCNLLHFLLPHYLKEGKSHLSLAVGCTGGQHRSVAVVERLARFLKNRGYQVNIHHRDLPHVEGR
ncbi:MAG TPA: RNase adapter RapZ [Peptococcaceae bacterium]|nr:RNase adapter RapZ [Peptococcaceae bacterium]